VEIHSAQGPKSLASLPFQPGRPDWAIFLLLGDFSALGRFSGSWTIFRLLGYFSSLGRFFSFGRFFGSWAIFRLLGNHLLWAVFMKNSQ
jgi:hypothetical protein